MIQMISRPIALLALLNGLLDAGRVLGIGAGGADPLKIYSVAGFALLGGFAISRIFAAVGIWINSNWGTPLLFGITFAELAIYLAGTIRLEIGMIGFVVRLVQLIGTVLILWFVYRVWRRGIHD